jgi:hypothetical protein
MMSPSPLLWNVWISPWSPPQGPPPDRSPKTPLTRAEYSPPLPPAVSFAFPTASSGNPILPSRR